jgi:uncharacterized protein (DUF58 family)
MLTARGSILVALAALGLACGLLFGKNDTSLASLALLLWIGLYWPGIAWLAGRRPLLRQVQRAISADHDENIVLTIHSEFPVDTTWSRPFDWAGCRFLVRDVVPDTFAIVEDQPDGPMRQSTRPKNSLSYTIRPAACGRFELPGLSVEVSDPCGMFRLQRFVPCRQQVTVLPWTIRPQTTNSVVKPHNILSTPGQHAHRRAGISAELLGIREYQPGDPPRTIAWKATARSGHVMSREFEMEVPVRTSIICGLSPHQFLQRPETSVADQVITAASSLARLVLSDRDPVALMLASENGTSRISHGGGQRQLVRILHHLLDATAQANAVEKLSDLELYEAILNAAWQRFPELFHPRVNSLPPLKLRFAPGKRRRELTRRRLALVLAHLSGMPPGYEIRLALDDEAMLHACRVYARHFPVGLPRHHSSSGQPLIDEQCALQHNLVLSLLQCQSRARDNELYVVVCELTALPRANQELLDAIRVCRAARHRVMLVETPPRPASADVIHDEIAARILTRRGTTSQTEGNSLLRRKLTALGVRCSNLDDPRMMQLVVDELDILRAGKSRGRSHHSFAH